MLSMMMCLLVVSLKSHIILFVKSFTPSEYIYFYTYSRYRYE